MSDDRFKQARRSLIDRHNQRQQKQGGGGDTFDGDFEDEKTALVDMNDRPQPPSPPAAPQFAPPPNFEGEDEKTEMISVDRAFESQQRGGGNQGGGHQGGGHQGGGHQGGNQPGGRPGGGHQGGNQPGGRPGGVQIRSHSGVQPSYDGFGGSQPPAGHGQNPNPPAPSPQHQQQYNPPPTEPGAEIAQANPNQSLVVGGESGYEGSTQFLNLNDFAQGESFTPDDTAAGYEGSTQFVNLNALQAGAAAEAAGGQMAVENDPALREQYQFGPESIQEGEFTLIFAQNAANRAVVLKRIWEGDPNGMPMPVRQRVQALDQIRHPRLISLNGMLASQTGAWVELNRPPGYRLTDIVHEHGPQPKETVVAWIQQAAEILQAIHQQGFVYGNLTTDAIWIQDDGSVLLEPFDVLAFEHRGNLGAFGPPEINFPPEQRQLYPATDVYCLAAVTVGALTGLPLNLGAVEGLDKKLAAGVEAGLQQNPQDRPQSMTEFVERLEKGGGGLPDLDFKFLLVGVAVLGIVGLGTAYFLRGPGGPPGGQGKMAQKQAGKMDPGKNAAAMKGAEGTAGMAAGTTGGTTGAPDAVAVSADAPGDIEQDPRLTVKKSYQLNPPAQEEDTKPDPNNPEAAKMRNEARELLVGIENLVPEQQKSKYGEAMEKLAAAIRLSGQPTPEDLELMEDLFAREDVKEIQKDYFDRVSKNLAEERVSRAKAIYPQLAGIDASAGEIEFFTRNKNLGVTKLEPVGGSDDDSDESEE